MNSLVAKINYLDPCAGGVEWLEQYTDEQQAWDECPRGDWMAWLLDELFSLWRMPVLADGRKILIRCCIECAETVSHLWPKEQVARIRSTVADVEAWCSGAVTTTEQQLFRALSRLNNAASGYDRVVVNAVHAVAAMQNPARAIFCAAAASASAAEQSPDTFVDAAIKFEVAKAISLRRSADVIRKYFPNPPDVDFAR